MDVKNTQMHFVLLTLTAAIISYLLFIVIVNYGEKCGIGFGNWPLRNIIILILKKILGYIKFDNLNARR